jgi:hypothetical protein
VDDKRHPVIIEGIAEVADSETQANQSRIAAVPSANQQTQRLSETFTLSPNPSPVDVMAFMKSIGRFLGLAAADCLKASVFTPENGACQSILAASANLIAAADGWRQFEQQREAALRQGGMTGVPSPPPPFRMH